MKKVCITIVIFLTIITMLIQVKNYTELLLLFSCLLLFYFVGIYIIQKIEGYLRIKKFDEEVKLTLNEDFIFKNK